MSEDLRAFLDAKALPAAVVVGHSMGSIVAQRFAIDHPSRLAGLVLMGAFATLHRNAGLTEWVRSSVLPLRDSVDAAFAREFQQSTLARPVPPQLLETVVSESVKVPARVWRATFQGFLETPDFSGELGKVRAPTLVVWGDRDGYALRGDQERLATVLPRARHTTYDGAGHGFHWEDPGRFARDLERFLDEDLASGSS